MLQILYKVSFAFFALLLCTPLPAISIRPTDADYREADQFVFLRDEVSIVELIFQNEGDFQDLIDNPQQDDLKLANMRFRNSATDELVPDVGVRIRGNFSRDATRKSFKVDFNDFVPGRAFRGLESFNLNGDNNDATMLRRRLAHDFKLRMGLPAARTHYVALYITQPVGDQMVTHFDSIKTHVEQIDEEFADSWFGNKEGNLYKCLFGQERADLSVVPGEDYQNHGNGTVYEEDNNDPLSDYTDLVEFIRFINQTNASERFSGLEHFVNIDNFLRYLATNVAVGSWDDYWYGSNNYYLYHNTDTGRFEWIPYDYDNSFGIDFFGTDWSTRFFQGWGDGGFGSTPAPLVDAVFDHSDWRQQFRRYLLQAADILSDPEFQALADSYHAQLLPWFDGTIEDGGLTGTQPSGGDHVPNFMNYNQPQNYQGGSFHTIGVVPFMNRRANSLRDQIQNFIGSTEPLPRVYINEVLASNTTGITDNFGELEDWLELYNDEDFAIDISGWHLSDNPSSPTLTILPAGTVIPSKSFLRIWCDGQPEQTEPGHIHTSFSLGAGGETVLLFTDESTGRVLVDFLTFPALISNRSYGPFPDGDNPPMIFETVTPGAPNDDAPLGGGGEPRTPPRLFINEFMAQNTAFDTDNFGEFEDWIEIYNDEDTAVDLSGLHLTDTLVNPSRWQFPAGASIPAKGFLRVWTDNQPEQTVGNIYHTNFALSRLGEEIGIFDNEENQLQPIHTIVFGPQEVDLSSGLLPDGQGDPIPLPAPSPGRSNVPPTDVWMILGQ